MEKKVALTANTRAKTKNENFFTLSLKLLAERLRSKTFDPNNYTIVYMGDSWASAGNCTGVDTRPYGSNANELNFLREQLNTKAKNVVIAPHVPPSEWDRGREEFFRLIKGKKVNLLLFSHQKSANNLGLARIDERLRRNRDGLFQCL